MYNVLFEAQSDDVEPVERTLPQLMPTVVVPAKKVALADHQDKANTALLSVCRCLRSVLPPCRCQNPVLHSRSLISILRLALLPGFMLPVAATLLPFPP